MGWTRNLGNLDRKSEGCARFCLQVVAAAGAVDHEELVQLSEKAFSSLSSDPTTAYDLVAKVSNVSQLAPNLQSR